jgi:hypothetical protein
LLREDPYLLTPDREEDVQLVEIALRRAQWKTPGGQPTEALMELVHDELERLMAVRPVTPKAPAPHRTADMYLTADVSS